MPNKCRLLPLQLSLIGLILLLGSYNPWGAAHASGKVAPTQVPAATEQPWFAEGQSWSTTGWFNIIYGDGPESDSETIYLLTDDGGQRTRLFVDDALSRSVGGILWLDRKKVDVEGFWATVLSTEGAVAGLKVTSISRALLPAAALSDDVRPAVIGAKPWVTIMCKFNDFADEPQDLPYFTGMYANIYPRLDHYWRELSYSTANVAGSNAYGWFTLPHPLSHYNPTLSTGGTDLGLLASDCTAVANPSVDFSLFRDGGINMMFNINFDYGWAWGGSMYMSLDGVTQSWSTTWEPPWAYADISVIQHEMGHGFGLPHSSGAYGATYDNVWDVMSEDRYNCAAATDATYGCVAQHTIAYHKDILGWIPSSQKFTATEGLSTITLEQLALPATGNFKMAQIPIGGSGAHFYTVEARRLTGYDSKLAGAAVIIHEVDTTRERPAYVIDTDFNGDTSDGGAMWLVGETFIDATNNISVRVDSATATGFQVTISNNPSLLDTPLSRGVALSDSLTASLTQDIWRYYYIDIPGGSDNLVVDLYDLAADLDLYVQQGSKPTLNSYSCRPYSAGTLSERCTFSSPASGRWWIGVNNWSTGTVSYTVKANWRIKKAATAPVLLLLLSD